MSIDDFGSGYSSLAHVASFPVDELKIPQSVIANVADDEGRPIVVALVRVAHALGLDVVADGVERADQVEKLRRMGCDIGQGYYWSQPLLSHELAQL